jgi:hypothetical protein
VTVADANIGREVRAVTCGTHEANRRVTALALFAAPAAPDVRAFAGTGRVRPCSGVVIIERPTWVDMSLRAARVGSDRSMGD